MEALGRLFNLSVATWPDSSAQGGANLTGTQGVTLAYFQFGGIGTGDLRLTFWSADSNNDNTLPLPVSRYYKITPASGVWTEINVTPASSTLTLAGAASQTFMLVFEFEASSLTPDNPVVNFMPTVGVAQPPYGAALWIAHDLDVQRSPARTSNITA